MGKTRKRKDQESLPTARAPKKRHQEPKQASTTATATRPPPSLFVEEPRGAELKLEVELYEQLSSQDEIERLDAADAVVSGLLSSNGVSEVVLMRHLERRLFRGLASGRKAARLGFSVVLTEVLSLLFGERGLVGTKYTGLEFERVLEILRAKTKPEGDMSGQEERDHVFGLLFGLQCFVRAKILFVEDQEDRWEKVFDGLVQLAKKKPWMRKECGWVIVEALEQMGKQQAEKTLENLHENGLAASPEGVGIWLTTRRKFPNTKFPSKPWGQNGNPLEHLKLLAKILKESSSASDKQSGERTPQTGNWRPQIHFAWDIVLHECISSTAAGRHDSLAAQFSDFWQVAVDESLFSSSASAERKFWGFLIFQKALEKVAHYPWLLTVLFSQNFMRCLINHISHEDRFLHRAAEWCLKSTLQAVEANHEIVTYVLPRLISGNGVYNFDQVTKTKTIDRLLSRVEGNHAHELIIRDLVSPVKTIKNADSAQDAEVRRQMLGDYVLTLIRRVNTADQAKDNNWVENHALPLLASLAFSKDNTYAPQISEKTRAVFKNRLNSAFTHLLSSPSGFTYPCNLLQTLKPNAVAMDKQLSVAKDNASAVMEKLLNKSKKAKEEDKKPIQALAMLYAFVILQLYSGESDAVSLLDELKICYDKLIRGKNNGASNSEASVALIEILLSFMSKQSLLLRRIAQQVFTTFSGDFTEESLELLVDVLESDESLKGQQDLFDQDNDELEDDDLDNMMDSDVELLKPNGISGHDGSDVTTEDDEDNDSTGEDEDEDEDEDDDDDENDTEAQRLDDALAKALGTHRADQEVGENLSDSDADMSDSEMMEVDSKLVEIFSQRKNQQNKKQERKDARENIINFKNRVLDLLEIYVKEQAASPQAFDLLPPLLRLMRTTTAKQVSERAHNVITAFAKASKGLKSTDNAIAFGRSQRFQILNRVHEEASKDESHAFARAASTASLLVATTLYRASRSNFKEIGLVYLDTQAKCVERDLRVQASFFHDWVNWWQSHVS